MNFVSPEYCIAHDGWKTPLVTAFFFKNRGQVTRF